MEAAEANPRRIGEHRELILSALPQHVLLRLTDQDAFINAVTRAVEIYLALSTKGNPRRREHRRTDDQHYPSAAHRPVDARRQALIGDLFDAYMTLRNYDIDARGFKKVADVVFEVARIQLTVTDNDRANLQERIHHFSTIAAADENPDKEK